MIGMMNNASSSIEFYGAAPAEDGTKVDTEFHEPKPKEKIEYTEDGRKVVNGKVVDAESELPKGLWTKTLLRGTLTHMMSEEKDDDEEGKPKPYDGKHSE